MAPLTALDGVLRSVCHLRHRLVHLVLVAEDARPDDAMIEEDGPVTGQGGEAVDEEGALKTEGSREDIVKTHSHDDTQQDHHYIIIFFCHTYT